ncbi:MAG: hypothetical protein JW958_05570 [Candidatus Eisenbacteria bacterium]|nr:hypothetical protein [Candidatus Eisenbacteria bacterium]
MRFVFRFFLLVAVIHLGVSAGTPYILYRFLDMRVDEIVAASMDHSEHWVKAQILEYAREKKIPLDPENVLVWRNRNDLRVWIEYDQTVNVPFHRFDTIYRVTYPEGTVPPQRYAGRSRSSPGS